MSVITENIQAAGYIEGNNYEVLPSGRLGYGYDPTVPDLPDFSCNFCLQSPKAPDEPRVTYFAVKRLCLCAPCTDRLLSSLIQDLARVVETEGFVAGRYMADREERIIKDVEDILFAGKVQSPPGRR